MQTCYRCSDTLHRCSLAKPKIKIVYTLKRLPLSLCSRFAKNGDSLSQFVLDEVWRYNLVVVDERTQRKQGAEQVSVAER